MRRKMRDVNSCRTLVNQNNPQGYFVSITIPQPKIRVKIPKLLMKNMRERKKKNNQGGVCSESNETSNDQKKAAKKKKRRGLSSILSSVFCTKKPSKEEMGHQDQNLPSTFKRHSLREHFEAAKEDEHKRKKNVVSFIKEKVKKKKKKTRKSTYSVSNVQTASICSSRTSGRFPRRVLTTREKSKMVLSSMKKRGSKRLVGVTGGEREMVEGNGGRTESSRSDKELCKKRILMGEKCKPLNCSGILQYDKEGMLLPDTFTW